MKLPRPAPEPTPEEVADRLKYWKERASAHSADPTLYALDHQKLNDLLDTWEQVRPVAYG